MIKQILKNLTTSAQARVTDQFHYKKYKQSNFIISIISEGGPLQHKASIGPSKPAWEPAAPQTEECVLSLVNLKPFWASRLWIWNTEPWTGASLLRQAGLKLHPKTFFLGLIISKRHEGERKGRKKEREDRLSFHARKKNVSELFM